VLWQRDRRPAIPLPLWHREECAGSGIRNTSTMTALRKARPDVDSLDISCGFKPRGNWHAH
jgi:hypothetical protein